LDQKNFLQSRDLKHPRFDLAHPSLRKSYQNALGPLTTEAHRRWLKLLLDHEASPTKAGAAAIPLAEHAFALQQARLPMTWGSAAAEHFEKNGNYEKAIREYERLLPLAQDDFERVLLYAHLAHLFNLSGQYENSLAAYDAWFKYRVDDETR